METFTADTSTSNVNLEATSQDVVENPGTGEELQTSPTSNDTTTSDTAKDDTSTDVQNDKQNNQQQNVDYEKSYKELQAVYTKSQQEIAELKKQLPQQPQIVNEQGQINPQFEQAFQHNLASYEFANYQKLATYLEDKEQAHQCMQLLNNAELEYSRRNIDGYNQLMSQVKQYFNPEYVEIITEQKALMKANKQAYLEDALKANKQQNAIRLETELRQYNDLWDMVNPESENYIPEMFNVVKEYNDNFGGLDAEALSLLVKKIADCAVKKYNTDLQDKKNAEMNKQKAGIATGDNITFNSNDMPTYAQIAKMSQEEYNKAYKKWGDKLLTAK